MSKVKKSAKSAKLARPLSTKISEPIIWAGQKLLNGGVLMNRHKRAVGVLAVVVSLGAGVASVGSNFEKVSASMVALGFGVADVTLDGRYRSQKNDILEALNVDVGTPILSIDLPQKQADIEALPWVKSARVARRLPNLLHIELEEYEPFARLARDRVVTLVDRNGAKITDSYLDKFDHLPIISGNGVELRAAHLIDTLDEYPVIRNRLVSAVWVKGRRWTLNLDHGGSVLLPEEGFEQALRRLMTFEETQRILAVANQTIDLRIDERVLLRPNRSTQNKIISSEARS